MKKGEIENMFEKIKTKWKKRKKEVEQKDIESIRDHPTRWKILMIATAMVFIGFSILITSLDPTTMPLAFIALISLYILEKEYLDRYRKAQM